MTAGRLPAATSLAVGALLLLGSARAQEPRAQEPSAQQLYEEGRKAMDRRDFAAACPKLRRSYEKEEGKGALYHLAQCEDESRAGRLATSLRLWKEVQDRFADQPDVQKEARERIAALEKKVARVLIRRAAGAPADMTVEIDGQDAPFDTAVPVDAGKHGVSASAAGYASQRVDVRVANGEQRTLDIDPGQRVAVTTTVIPVPPTGQGTGGGTGEDDGAGSGWTTAGFVAGGVGVAGLVLFAISAPIIAGAESDLDEACPSRTSCPAEAALAADRGETWMVPNAIGLVTGVVGVGLGVTFLVVGSNQGPVQAAVRSDRVELRGHF